MSFSSLGLSEPLLRAVEEKGYSQPSPIQSQSIPPILEGRDVMAAAQTGTGKTAGFTLPLLQRLASGTPVRANRVRALVLTPTRELAAQVGESAVHYGKFLPLKSTVVFGGVKINPQMMKLRGGVDLLVATPGRLLDLHGQGAVRFDDLEVLVLDEADRMLDMGFIHDIKRILKLLPSKRQNLLFSATFSDEIRRLAQGLVHDPVLIEVSPRNSTTSSVEQWIHPVDKKRKAELLCHLIKDHNWHQVLVFSRTKHGANKLVQKLEREGIHAMAIHGNKSQGARTRALDNFKRGSVRVLVATDIAARGLDIQQLPQVVNFDLPNVAEDYVHRIGRTGRAGATGQAVSLVSPDESKQLNGIERLIKRKIDRVPLTRFHPEAELPETKNVDAPVRRRRPKKPKTAQNAARDGAAAPESGNNVARPKAAAAVRGARRDSAAPRGRGRRRQEKPALLQAPAR
ncbi:DEAD/DEAH box helicase [Motiliproteus sp. SC1-56]|uniref:DEAD/DEAH box helicase n=1 Tax=Motiliproteus sp. SC1-56 TaxID=2799565 RepID=UPI001A8D314D|nr:DEAD/DEAH box helicase [Motiliproteus sp. SC1-56]